MRMTHLIGGVLLPLALAGCALSPPARVALPTPAQWQTPLPAQLPPQLPPQLPHNGSLTDLAAWWGQHGDPLLVQLIDSAQAASPTIADAGARIAGARAQRVAASAALLPSLDAGASVTRANQQSLQPGGTTSLLGLQSAWEIDLFGGRTAERNAARARLAGATAQWHQARVAVAAEVASTYFSLRTCQQLLTVAEQDAASRADTARLTKLTADAGFQPPATAALARASAAEASGRATLQRALCDIDITTLVAITAIDAPSLRARLAASRPVTTPAIVIPSVPAQVLAQRPDVFAAESEVAAASFDVGSAQAQRFPRLSLAGSIGAGNFRSGGESLTSDTWSIGPLAVSVPIFDAGARRANVDTAKARYEAAVVGYRATARGAVREVEQALINLNSSTARSGDAQTSLEGYRIAFVAAEDRYKNGLGSLLELEDARRTRLASENAVVTLARERSAAWVALYRAAGGGWSPAAN